MWKTEIRECLSDQWEYINDEWVGVDPCPYVGPMDIYYNELGDEAWQCPACGNEFEVGPS